MWWCALLLNNTDKSHLYSAEFMLAKLLPTYYERGTWLGTPEVKQ